VILAGGALGGQRGMMLAFIFALFMNGGSYWFSDKIALAMTGSTPISREENTYLYSLVERLSRNAGKNYENCQ
ncbi:MAG TPA: protease HtpX, partial [Desulfobacteria bacterium]|nr:protease HtpX [Desulfobacteria bacterium]